jgi:hypothetical protein
MRQTTEEAIKKQESPALATGGAFCRFGDIVSPPFSAARCRRYVQKQQRFD